MATEGNHVHELMEKLESLSPEHLAEVEDFIDFLRRREREQSLIRAACRIAEPSLRQIWEDLEDAVYDSL